MATPEWECLQPALQQCADNDPQSFLQYCPCSCATEAVIYICNSNHVTDDNFDIILNGTNIGSIDLNTNPETNCSNHDAPGGWWSTDPSITPHTIGTSLSNCFSDNKPNDVLYDCCVDGLVTFTLSPSLLIEGANNLYMLNTQDNGFANYGRIGVFKVTASGYICNHVVDEYYSGGYGEDMSFDFNWTWQTTCGTTGLREKKAFIKKNNKIYVDTKYLSNLKKNQAINQKIIEKQQACKMQALYEGKTNEEAIKFKLELVEYAKQLKITEPSKEKRNQLLEKKIIDSKRFNNIISSGVIPKNTEGSLKDCNCRRKIKLN